MHGIAWSMVLVGAGLVFVVGKRRDVRLQAVCDCPAGCYDAFQQVRECTPSQA